MPLQTTGLMTRRALTDPEDDPVHVTPPALELVLKFNPNHGPDGRFASSGGGRRGGTAGSPTTGAFGQPLNTRRRSHTVSGQGGSKIIIPGQQPRASAADIAADKLKWTPGKSFAEHKATGLHQGPTSGYPATSGTSHGFTQQRHVGGSWGVVKPNPWSRLRKKIEGLDD